MSIFVLRTTKLIGWKAGVFIGINGKDCVKWKGFDSYVVDAPLAQLVEQRILNPWVVGSSPTWRTIFL